MWNNKKMLPNYTCCDFCACGVNKVINYGKLNLMDYINNRYYHRQPLSVSDIVVASAIHPLSGLYRQTFPTTHSAIHI